MYITSENYREVKIFDLFSVFYTKAQKINAQVNFSTTRLSIYKNGKHLICTFVLSNQTVVNKKTVGYVDISFAGMIFKVYLTEDFEWIINIDNRMVKKFSTTEIDYIFYKCYGEI